jgi:hypothetical protein
MVTGAFAGVTPFSVSVTPGTASVSVSLAEYVAVLLPLT